MGCKGAIVKGGLFDYLRNNINIDVVSKDIKL